MSKIGLVYSANEDLFSIAIVVGMTFTSVIAVNAKTGDLWLYEELCMRLSNRIDFISHVSCGIEYLYSGCRRA